MIVSNDTKNKTALRRGLIIALIVACLGARFLFLESDPPAWGVSFYQPADEGPYAYLAINYKTYGALDPSTEITDGHATWVSENFIMNIVGNLCNIVGFKVFGNNYYGLRVPYVIISFINYILVAVLLNKLRKRYRPDDNQAVDWMLLLLLWLAVDFSMLLSSRYVEPSAVRMTLTLIIAKVYVSMPESEKLRYFITGFLITFSCFLVYITNIFLYLAIGIVLLYIAYKKGFKAFMRSTIWFVAGCAVCFVLAELYYVAVWDTEALRNALESVLSFSEDSMATGDTASDPSIAERIGGLAVSILRVFSANSLAYNIPALFAMIVTGPALFRMINRRKDLELMFLTLIPVAFAVQSFLAYDTVSRKMVIVFPVMICTLYAIYLCYKDGCDKAENNIREASNLWVIFATFFVALVFAYRFLLFDQSCDDYSLPSIAIIFVLEFLPVAVFASIYVALHKKVTNTSVIKKQLSGYDGAEINNEAAEQNGINQERFKMFSGNQIKWAGGLIVLMCACNLLYDYIYVWHSPSYGEKDAMIKMADYVDDQYVLGGGFQLGYTLYNNMRPIVTSPKETMKQSKVDERTMIFEYSNEEGKMDSYFNRTYFKKTKKRFIPDYTVERKYYAFGESRDMCIYRTCNAGQYAAYLRERAEKDDVEYPSKNKDVKGSDIDMITFMDVYGDIHGDIDHDLYGDVYGNIYGDVNATIHGSVLGEIFGEVNGSIEEREEE